MATQQKSRTASVCIDSPSLSTVLEKKNPHTLSRDGLYMVGVETAVKHVSHVQLGRDLMIAKPDIICHKTIHWGYCQPEREHSNQDGIVSSKDNHSEELYIDWQWPFCLGFKWTLKSCTMLHSKTWTINQLAWFKHQLMETNTMFELLINNLLFSCSATNKRVSAISHHHHWVQHTWD